MLKKESQVQYGANGNGHSLKIIPFLLMVLAMLTGTLKAQNSETLESLLLQMNADSLHQTVLDLQNFGSRFALREGGNIGVAEYIVQRLNNYGVPAAIDSFYKSGNNWLAGPYNQWFYNVKGVLPAQEPVDDSIVIVGAHLDAISYDHQTYELLAAAPGADDNASGVAVMLELARICHEEYAVFAAFERPSTSENCPSSIPFFPRFVCNSRIDDFDAVSKSLSFG